MMKSKSPFQAFALTAVLALAAGPSFAGGWGDWGNDAFSFAAAGGNVNAYVDAHKGGVTTESKAKTVTRADTYPTYGAGTAELDQLATLQGWDRHYIDGAIVMDGSTDVGALVGKRGEEAGTQTFGLVALNGVAYGDKSSLDASGLGKSNEESVAVDTPWGGYSDAQAQQLSIGEISGRASGKHSAGVSVGVQSVAAAETN